MLNLAALLLAEGASAASQSWSFTVSVSDDTELSTGIPVNLYNQGDITMAVNWGDGSTSVLTSDDYSALTDMEASIHTYSEAGEYAVTLTSGDWSDFYFEANSSSNTGSNTSYYALYYFRQTVISIDTALPEVAGVRYRESWTTSSSTKYMGFSYMFRKCTSLTSLPEGLFDNNTAAEDFRYCFNYCSSLASLPEGLFDNNTAAEDFRHCFSYCSSLASLPEGLFDNNTAADYFAYCFCSCSSLTSLPEGLFDNNTAVTHFQYCFYDCSALTSIPEGLFANNTSVANFQYCFYGSFLCDGSIHIGSADATEVAYFMSSSSVYDRYVYVPASGTTADFLVGWAYMIDGMTVIRE